MLARTHLLLVVVLAPGAVAFAAAPRSDRGAVASEHRLAAEAGAEVLRAGGTAVDAAIATAAAVCVVHAASCGIGGGGFALVHLSAGADLALDFRERAPARATASRFLDDAGKPVPGRTRTGGLAVAVPGEVAGWALLHRRAGHLPLARVLAPAIRLARDGFRLGDAPHLAREIGRSTRLLAADPGLRSVFLTGDGSPPGPEFRVVQRDLARTLEIIARDGARGFYAGPVAAALVKAVAAQGGVLSMKDLEGYAPIWREPLTGSFRGRHVVTFPPPGSGGVVLEALGMIGAEDIAARDPVGRAHLLASVLAQAFADRARWYGDPGFTRVPTAQLLASTRLGRLRQRITDDAVSVPDVALDADHGTAHLSVVDGAGNAVALTTTINTAFGAGFTVPGTGIILNNEMDDFAVAPGAPNVYGLTGTTANAIVPGKRPQSSMSPTIVLDGKRPQVVVGGSGGPFIISGVVQTILGVLALDRGLPEAVGAPRIHCQGGPDVLVEPGIDETTRTGLERIGHRVTEMTPISAVAAVGIAPDGTPVAAGDRRKDGGEVINP